MKTLVPLFAGVLLFPAGQAAAQEGGEALSSTPAAAAPGADHDLASQVANPVASLISVPIQNNFDCCFGPSDAERYTLNIQPVIPISLGEDWQVITRTILPLISQGSVAPGVDGATDFGDVTQSFFFKPKRGEGLTWALGPVFVWPTGGSGFGGGKFGAGPTGLLLKQGRTGITVGMLANHVWSYAGKDDREKRSATLIQPFFTKTFKDTTSVGINSEAGYDWVHDQWSVPVNLTVGHLFKVGRQPLQLSAAARYYVESPPDGPRWGARLTATFLFPE